MCHPERMSAKTQIAIYPPLIQFLHVSYLPPPLRLTLPPPLDSSGPDIICLPKV